MRLIDAEEMKRRVETYGLLGDGYEDSERKADVINMLDDCKTVDAVPVSDAMPVVHGRWKRYELQNKPIRVDCSVCRSEIEPYAYQSYKYCPRCGSKMDLNGGR